MFFSVGAKRFYPWKLTIRIFDQNYLNRTEIFCSTDSGIALTHQWTMPCKKSCISSGILTCFSQADLGLLLLAFNGRPVPQIMPGYRRRFALQYHTGNKEMEVDLWGLLGSVFRPGSNFACFQEERPSFKHPYWITVDEHGQSGCSSEKAHPEAFLTCASVDRECRKCI
jgi:hypothetical protein